MVSLYSPEAVARIIAAEYDRVRALLRCDPLECGQWLIEAETS
jgi:hypothetical protein